MSPLTSPHGAPLEAMLDDLWLDLDELCRLAGVDARWVHQRITDGLIAARPVGAHDAWRFDAVQLQRVRRMACIERDFDAVPELAALVADLEDEVRLLRRRLARLSRRP